jgi:hypothetical protein
MWGAFGDVWAYALANPAALRAATPSAESPEKRRWAQFDVKENSMTIMVSVVFVAVIPAATTAAITRITTITTITNNAIMITWESIKVPTQKHRSGAAAPLLLRSLPHPLPQVHHSQASHCSLLRVYSFRFKGWEGTFVCRRSQMQADNRKNLARGNVAERGGSSSAAIGLVPVRRGGGQVL